MPLQTSSTVTTKTFDRTNPFQSEVLSKYRVSRPGSSKETWHIVFNLEGSGITYRPGDSIAIYPENAINAVENILQAMSWSPDCEVVDERTKKTYSAAQFFASKVNLSKPSKRLIQELVNRGKSDWNHYLQCDEALTSFTSEYTVDELLQLAPGLFSSPQELVSLLGPLLPRFYSISSSQGSVGEEVHCTIAHVAYEVNGKKRVGVCSDFLCKSLVDREEKVNVYIQPTKDFILPTDPTTPIIMVGPGTGVAPFLAFMQERAKQVGATSKNWLFFGEREKQHDFYYEEYWKGLVQEGKLRLDTAFSRDQAEKEYVQHKMWQNRKELWQYLQEGAKLYVCGDANKMAKDVDATLHNIACEEAGMSIDEARAYYSLLRKEKRYLRDVY